MNVDGVFGSSVLSRFLSVTFDYYNKVLWLVPRPWLGVKFRPGTQELIIDKVILNSPADKAGLKSEDIILQLNNTGINNLSQILPILENLKIGDKVILLIQRGNEK